MDDSSKSTQSDPTIKVGKRVMWKNFIGRVASIEAGTDKCQVLFDTSSGYSTLTPWEWTCPVSELTPIND